MNHDSIVIVSIARTPQGKMLGDLKDFTTPQLGSVAIKAAVERAQIKPTEVTDVIMGCVLPAGLGQAPARQAAMAAGLPISAHCTTVNKMCGSGMQAVILAYQALLSTDAHHVYVAGGMESMSNAPYLIPKARQGYRLGHAQMLDHMLLDGLEDAYDKGRPMGYFADECAQKYQISREEQDLFALGSLERAKKAIRDNVFVNEIIPIAIKNKQGERIIDADEHPGSVNLDKIPQLPPIFNKEGTVTAASSSSISDGAAALVLMRESEAIKRGIKPLARILDFSSHSKAPEQFTTAPIDAIQKLLKKLNWTVNHVDLFEINEAFAVVPLAAMSDLMIPREKINIHGGGCALGHPIGATGARIIVTLISALQTHQLKYGIAALCIGGGEATAIALENLA
jgi:acetyl-CoA C-acetyltransferase